MQGISVLVQMQKSFLQPDLGAFGSHCVQVPVVFQVRNGGFKFLQLSFFAGDKNIDVIGTDVLVQRFTLIELAQGIAQVVGQALLQLFVGLHAIGEPGSTLLASRW